MGIIEKIPYTLIAVTVCCDYVSAGNEPCTGVYTVHGNTIEAVKAQLGSIGWRVVGRTFFCPECVNRVKMAPGYYSRERMRLAAAQRVQERQSRKQEVPPEMTSHPGAGAGIKEGESGWEDHCRNIIGLLDQIGGVENGSDKGGGPDS